MPKDSPADAAPRRPIALFGIILLDVALAFSMIVAAPTWMRLLHLLPPCPSPARWLAIGWLAIAILHLAAAVGLFLLRRWGLYLQWAVTVVDLPLVCPTLPALVILVYLSRQGTRLLFQPRSSSIRGGRQETNARVPSLLSGFTAALAFLFAALAVIFGLRATAIDISYERRMLRERSALADLRALVSAEEAFSRASGGFYANPACLVEPGKCLPGGSARTPFLNSEDKQRYEGERLDYLRAFHRGPTAPGATPSTDLLASYAFAMTPVAYGQSGCAAFCADSTGTVCKTYGEGALRVINGRCDRSTCMNMD